MSESADGTAPTCDLSLTVDRWLRFDSQVAARYEAEYGEQRHRHLQLAIGVGLVFYNLYNLTSIVLLQAERSGYSGAEILAQADAALYQAKNRGRNQYALGGNSRSKTLVCS